MTWTGHLAAFYLAAFCGGVLGAFSGVNLSMYLQIRKARIEQAKLRVDLDQRMGEALKRVPEPPQELRH